VGSLDQSGAEDEYGNKRCDDVDLHGRPPFGSGT
jgi:hypothetical protein